ncbi:hypothetical protein CI109_106512 [Kwoniella shandongensis]|uniref:Pheromone n=1 Tax=Kwoniella shandongensis TaxID=1734106 RepID=A0AAJ8LQF2_9TREE
MDAFTAIFTVVKSAATSSEQAPRTAENDPFGVTASCVVA